MIDLSLLPDGGIGWLDASGPKGSIVLSTRIRLARNLEGYVFSQRAKDADRTAVLTRVEEASAASDLLKGAATIRLDQTCTVGGVAVRGGGLPVNDLGPTD